MTALDDYGPFDAGLGANRNEDFWRDYFRHLTGSGVIDGIGSEFAVSERGAGANMSVDVASGECFIRGHWGESTSTKNMAISAAHATLARIDRVVLRTDFTANTISIEVIEGTPNATPAAPALTQSSSRWEISLAQISIPAADTSIGSAQITSERTIIGFPTFDQSTAPADGDTWTYNATTGLWEPAASSGTSGMEVIAESVLGSASASISFASIPATYRHLRVVFHGRGDTGNFPSVNLRFNNDSGANYDQQRLEALNTTVSGAPLAGQTLGIAANISGFAAPANAASSVVVDIPNYRGTTFQKSALCIGGPKYNSTVADFGAQVHAIWWRSTAAIDRVDLLCSAGNFVAGTVATLYGLASA